MNWKYPKPLLILPLFLFVILLATSPGMSRKKSTDPSVGLALGSGGAVGLAHISMLKVFDDLKIRPRRIVGTSIGAVIGALYAAGLNATEIEEIFAEFAGSEFNALSKLVRANSGLSLGDLLEIDIENGGLIKPDGFLEFLAGKIKARRFDELAIPLEIVATDFWSGDPVVMAEGDLFTAVRASMAVPGLFSPVRRDGKLLIDGGMSNPLPFDLLSEKSDFTVAVDVTGTRSADAKDRVDLTEIYFNAFEIMQQSIISEKINRQKPDIYLKPMVTDVRLLHFNRIESIMKQAQPAALELRKKLQAALNK